MLCNCFWALDSQLGMDRVWRSMRLFFDVARESPECTWEPTTPRIALTLSGSPWRHTVFANSWKKFRRSLPSTVVEAIRHSSRNLFRFSDLTDMDRAQSVCRSAQRLLHPNLEHVVVPRIRFFLSGRELFVIARTDTDTDIAGSQRPTLRSRAAKDDSWRPQGNLSHTRDQELNRRRTKPASFPANRYLTSSS